MPRAKLDEVRPALSNALRFFTLEMHSSVNRFANAILSKLIVGETMSVSVVRDESAENDLIRQLAKAAFPATLINMLNNDPQMRVLKVMLGKDAEVVSPERMFDDMHGRWIYVRSREVPKLAVGFAFHKHSRYLSNTENVLIDPIPGMLFLNGPDAQPVVDRLDAWARENLRDIAKLAKLAREVKEVPGPNILAYVLEHGGRAREVLEGMLRGAIYDLRAEVLRRQGKRARGSSDSITLPVGAERILQQVSVRDTGHYEVLNQALACFMTAASLPPTGRARLDCRLLVMGE